MKPVEPPHPRAELSCTRCGADILLGEPLYWAPVHGLSRWHEACARELGLIEAPVPVPAGRKRGGRAQPPGDSPTGRAARPRPRR